MATPMELGQNVNDQIQICLEPQLLAAPKVGNSDPTPVAIPMGVSMQVVANLTIPLAAGRNDMIPDANNGVAIAEINTHVADLVENRRREVHTPVVGEKRKGTKTATEPSKTTLQKKAHLKGTFARSKTRDLCKKQRPLHLEMPHKRPMRLPSIYLQHT